MTWGALESGIRAWVAGASGVTAIWSQQDGDEPPPTYVSMLITDVVQVGRDWLEVVDANPAVAGAEIVHRASGQRRATLSLQAFTGPATGAYAPARLLESVRSRTRLPTYADALAVAGASILSFGAILSLGEAIGKRFTPRAAMEVHLLLSSEVSELSTYIEHVEVTDLVTGHVDEIDRV